jgi:hypothetical protein
MSSPLYCNRDCSLVFGAHAGLPAGANLSVFRYVTAQHFYLFVINDRASIGAKLADARV